MLCFYVDNFLLKSSQSLSTFSGASGENWTQLPLDSYKESVLTIRRQKQNAFHNVRHSDINTTLLYDFVN